MCRADAKAGLSEPMLPRRRGKDHQIKATPGITGWYRPSVHSDGGVRHLDVDSSHPGGGEAPKGLAVRQLKRYVSWVQTVNLAASGSNVRVHKSTHIGEFLIIQLCFNLSYVRIIPREVVYAKNFINNKYFL